jgi:hypothetical protein
MLEIRLFRNRDAVIEQIPIALGADFFLHHLPYPFFIRARLKTALALS